MKYVVMALFLLGCTLVAPAIVWAVSGRRRAWEAWRQYAAWFGGMLVLGAIAFGVMSI